MKATVESKKIKPTNPFKRGLAWFGSVFLWFITPTYASALWERWLKEKDEAKKPS